MSKAKYKTYEHNSDKLTVKDYIEELEQDNECVTNNDLYFKIVKINDDVEDVGLKVEVFNENSLLSALTIFKSKKQLINWVILNQLLLAKNSEDLINKSKNTMYKGDLYTNNEQQ